MNEQKCNSRNSENVYPLHSWKIQWQDIKHTEKVFEYFWQNILLQNKLLKFKSSYDHVHRQNLKNTCTKNRQCFYNIRLFWEYIVLDVMTSSACPFQCETQALAHVWFEDHNSLIGSYLSGSKLYREFYKVACPETNRQNNYENINVPIPILMFVYKTIPSEFLASKLTEKMLMCNSLVILWSCKKHFAGNHE